MTLDSLYPETPRNKYILPLFILVLVSVIATSAYLFYINTLPFGLKKSATLTVGSETDTLNEFRILPASNWGSREVDDKGVSFRTLTGSATLYYGTTAVLNNAKVNVSIKGENVSIFKPIMELEKSKIIWTKNWDFSEKIPTDFKGTAYVFDKCGYFDGKSLLYIPDTANLYEKGPFSVYVEWLPAQDLEFQEIVGHYNWEIFQSKNFVIFQIGKTTDENTPFYSIKAPIDESFFNKKHSIVAQYSPNIENGYMELFVDGKFIERKYIKNSTIDAYYGDRNLTLGWSAHNYQKNPYFKGCIYYLGYKDDVLFTPTDNIEYYSKTADLNIPIVGAGKLYEATIHVNKSSK